MSYISTLPLPTRLPSYSQWDPNVGNELPDYHSQHGPLVLDPPSTANSPSPTLGTTSYSYFYTAKRVAVSLGPRHWGTATAAFGMNATISGWVEVQTPAEIESVVITVEGHAFTLVKYPGGIAVPQVTTTTLHLRQALYKRNGASSHGTGCSVDRGVTAYSITTIRNHHESFVQYPTRTRFPFSIQLPKERKIPPTFSETRSSVSAHVRYQIRVDVTRKGLAWRDRLIVPFLYLPKSMPPYHHHLVDPLPIGFDWKLRSDYDSLQWKEFDAECSDPSRNQLVAKLHLPYPLIYKSGTNILYQISLGRRPGPESTAQSFAWWDSLLAGQPETDKRELEDRVSVKLIQLITIPCQGKQVRREVAIGKGIINKVVPLSQGDTFAGSKEAPENLSPGVNPSVVLQGEVKTGREGGEMTWAIPGLIEVDYAIHLSFKLPSSSASLSFMGPTFECTQLVGLTTHSREEIMFNASGTDEPALGMVRGVEYVKNRRRPRIIIGKLK